MRESWESERDPLACLAKGDPELFELFVEAEAGTFAGFFSRLGADPQEAEDLTQDLFIKLYNRAENYIPQTRFAPFVFRVARNAWIDRSRRKATRIRQESSTVISGDGEELPSVFDRTPGPGCDASEISSDREEAERLNTALASLSEIHRAVFELGALQELSYAEVGDLLDIPVGTVKSRMFYALRRLRELLAPDAGQSETETSTAGGRP